MDPMNIAKLVLELLGGLGQIILEAVENGDPATMQKVHDLLPDGPLKSRTALLEAEARAAARLNGSDSD